MGSRGRLIRSISDCIMLASCIIHMQKLPEEEESEEDGKEARPTAVAADIYSAGQKTGASHFTTPHQTTPRVIEQKLKHFCETSSFPKVLKGYAMDNSRKPYHFPTPYQPNTPTQAMGCPSPKPHRVAPRIINMETTENCQSPAPPRTTMFPRTSSNGPNFLTPEQWEKVRWKPRKQQGDETSSTGTSGRPPEAAQSMVPSTTLLGHESVPQRGHGEPTGKETLTETPMEVEQVPRE